jgi:hypothetical protein
VVGNLEHVPANGEVGDLFVRLPSLPAPEPSDDPLDLILLSRRLPISVRPPRPKLLHGQG